MARTETSKITLSTFQPKRLPGLAPTVHSLLLGYLIGKGIGLVEATSVDKSQIFTGLKGEFEAFLTKVVNNDTGEIETRDGVPYFPDSIFSGKAFIQSPFGDKFVNALTDQTDPTTGQVVEEAAHSISLAYAVSVQRAGNPAGYEWILTPLTEDKREVDPLAEMRALIPGMPAQAMLAAPATEPQKKAK